MNNKTLRYSPYLTFPFGLNDDRSTPRLSQRKAHIFEQVMQVLYTQPEERVFRNGFGIGVRQLVFEPNNMALRELIRKRLLTSLAQALEGEVDPKTIQIYIDDNQSSIDEGKLIINVKYTLARLGVDEEHNIPVGVP
ncbi:MAG: GPW/gp25 family protein [Gammaproteobacteria bacterium]|nr:GPW/gp25 family protein [Gammaproteobacteria bacterium]